eukprot:3370532-Amphidinium_carterae.1
MCLFACLHQGLVGKLELRLVEVDEAENEEDEVPTPRHQAGGASAQTNVQTDASCLVSCPDADASC